MSTVSTLIENSSFDKSDGKSVYELAVEEGYTGTQAEWFSSIWIWKIRKEP